MWYVVVLVEFGVVILLLLRSSATAVEWWWSVGCGIVACCGVGWRNVVDGCDIVVCGMVWCDMVCVVVDVVGGGVEGMGF